MNRTRFEMYLEALRRPVRNIAKLEFLYPDMSPWFVLDNNHRNRRSASFLQGGNLTVNLNNGMRRTADVILANENGEFDFDLEKLWFNQMVRLSMGLILPDGSEYYVPQGVFYIKDPESILEPSRKHMRLQLVDKWAYLDGTLHGHLEATHEIALNENIYTSIQTILALDRGDGKPIDSVPPLFTNFYDDKTVTLTDGTVIPVLNTPYTARNDRGTYADILLELNTMLSGMIGYNSNGQLQIDPSQDDISDGDKPVLWNFRLDESELSGAAYNMSLSQVYNDIIVTGAVIDGVNVRGRATNRSIRSPFNVQTIGLKTMPPGETESDRFVTDGQCLDWAKWLLKYNTVMKCSVSIKCSQIFHLYENALVTLYRPDKKNALERHLINGFTLPIGNGPMIINAASVSDLPEF